MRIFMKNCSDWELHKQPAAGPARIEQDLMMIKSRTCCCSTEHVAGLGPGETRSQVDCSRPGRAGAVPMRGRNVMFEVVTKLTET